MVAYGALPGQKDKVSSGNESGWNGGFPVDSFINSFNVMKEALVPLESGFRQTVKGLESQFLGAKSISSESDSELFAQLSAATHRTDCGIGSCHTGAPDAAVGEKIRRNSIKVPIKGFGGLVFRKSGGECKSDFSKKKLKDEDGSSSIARKDDGSCANCLQFAMLWSLLFNNFVQAIPGHFKSVKKCFRKQGSQNDKERSSSLGRSDTTDVNQKGDFPLPCVGPSTRGSSCRKENIQMNDKKDPTVKDGERAPVQILIAFVFEQFSQNLHNVDQSFRENACKNHDPKSYVADPKRPSQGELSSPQFHLEIVTDILKNRKADVGSLLANLRFARMGGLPTVVEEAPAKEDSPDNVVSTSESDTNSPQKIAAGLLNIPLSNVEKLRSTISTKSLTELLDLVIQIRKSSHDHPDKKKLFSVQDFFRYTQSEGRRLFDELDRDGDGQVTLEDLEIAMRKRRLPRRYAHDFLRRTRSHLFAKSFGWSQFLSLMEQKEPTILRAYTTLCLSKSGTLQKSQILESLKNAGLPANEDNAVAMMRFLNADAEESISYGHFRNFMLLLPSERLEDDPRNIWFEAATLVAVPPPVEIPAGSVLKSALAGGLACALSTSLLHPIDSMKTRVQASTLSFPELVRKLPEIGLRGLYRGSIPAILGQFSSHGLRTGIFEASKLLLTNVAPTVPEIQIQSLASFCSTILGTAVRIPCEVLKQRLQAGIFDNVGDALIGTLQQDGLKGFFRGTGATLCREVPFYVAGMGLYAEAKKATQQILRRELEPWETIVVGALSGGLAAVVTTPFDVMKTRTMTAPQGVPVTMTTIAFSILRNEGPLGLFKGAVPRFFWIAPLGAMNFAGYELAKKAMIKKDNSTEETTKEQLLIKAR
ncbi:uncharacterized protein LOC116254218 [Nymphaea colorata]|nr:uncharacterized protein LOC116254218 [Nymphaea colorata]